MTTCPPDLPARTPCRLAFVAEAPSNEEIAHKVAGVPSPRPMVGPSGRVFNSMLRCANIERAECLVTNVFNIQAPDNDVKGAWTVSRKEAEAREWLDQTPLDGRYFEPEFLTGHLARLGDELQAAQPTVVVPLGATALWALTGATNITAARGAAALATRTAPGVKLLPTFHPAHVIHQWKFFHVVVGDMMKAVAEAEAGPKLVLPTREIWVEPTLADIQLFRDQRLLTSELISCDIETGAGQITCIGFAPDAKSALVIPFVDWRKPSRSYWPTADMEVRAMTLVRGILDLPNAKLLQNGPYDLHWLWDKWHMPVRNYREDTRLLHHAIYPELPKDLGFMGACYAQQGPWKLLRNRQSEKRDE